MPRLGAVIGAILAELARARAMADRVSKDLVAEYEDDPVLATIPVPRITVSDADIALRFTVRDVEESEPRQPDAGEVLEGWQKVAGEKALPIALERLKLNRREVKEITAIVRESGSPLVGRATITEMRAALKGDTAPAVAKTVAPILEHFSRYPAELREKLGGKIVFSRRLTLTMSEELSGYVRRQFDLERVKAALASNVDVVVTQEELPDDPAQTQEIRLSLRGDDLDVLLVKPEEEGG